MPAALRIILFIRAFISAAGWAALGLEGGAEPLPAASASGPGIELLRDLTFARGFTVLAPKAGGGELGRIQFAGVPEAPVWQVAQWHSRFPFTHVVATESGALSVSNATKWLHLDRRQPDSPTLMLGVDSRPEYDQAPRGSPSQPWVHLLVQQEIRDAPSLAEATSLRLRFEARLREAETFRPEGYSPALHAAQFQIVLALNNTRHGSAGFGDFLWFVVPVYDDRYAVPPPYVAQDFAVTQGKLIYNPGGEAIGLRPLRPGQWQGLDLELRPWLERALRAAWDKGYLPHSREEADYRLAHLNYGWEVPGLNRVAMEVRGLSLRARTRNTHPAEPGA